MGAAAHRGGGGGVVEECEDRVGEGGVRSGEWGVGRGDEEAGFVVGDDFGCAAGVAGDDGFGGERGFDVDEAEWFAVRGQAHHVDRRHEVGHVAAEAEEFEAVGDAEAAGRLFQLGPQRAFAEAPELGVGNRVEHERGGLDEFAMSLLGREMGERADDGRAWFRAKFAADIGARAGWPQVVGVERVVEHGDSVGVEALVDQVLLHRGGAGDEVALAAMPHGPR